MEPKSTMEENPDLKSYLSLGTVIVQKQAGIIGLDLAISKARKNGGILVDDSGKVFQLWGDPVELLGGLVEEYACLSGEAAVKFSAQAIEGIVKNNPHLKLPKQLQKGYSPAEEFLKSF